MQLKFELIDKSSNKLHDNLLLSLFMILFVKVLSTCTCTQCVYKGKKWLSLQVWKVFRIHRLNLLEKKKTPISFRKQMCNQNVDF